ncbi:hypothetical protein P692DRAFT_201267858 [Suillus brevipes Sb2]|nr:hypothetical protein P692DRAFT_201267858 [Suillus brevipes Sb2]
MITHGRSPLGTIRHRFTPRKNESGVLVAEISTKARISHVSPRVLSTASKCYADEAPRASPYFYLSLDGPMHHRFLRVLYHPVNVGPYSEDSFSVLCSGRRLYLWCNGEQPHFPDLHTNL